MAKAEVGYCERAEAMTENENAVCCCGRRGCCGPGLDAETIVSEWSLVYYFRDGHRRCSPLPVTNLWNHAGYPYRDWVVHDRAEGRLGLQPPGSMTKPAKR